MYLGLAKAKLAQYLMAVLANADIRQLQDLQSVVASKSAILEAAFKLAKRAFAVGVGILSGVIDMVSGGTFVGRHEGRTKRALPLFVS